MKQSLLLLEKREMRPLPTFSIASCCIWACLSRHRVLAEFLSAIFSVSYRVSRET
uniref:Uncharacterized protein n=1 Tax=Anguilla anguilla TaxID=7936 RepID=A0A0E9QNZ0_ANGAN